MMLHEEGLLQSTIVFSVMSQCQGSMVNKFQVRQTLVRVVSLSGRSWCIADAALFLFPELRSWCD